MLDLQSILWVIPGFIFAAIYNRRKPGQAVNLSGWPYFFFVALIAAITWIPAEIIAPGVFNWLKNYEWLKPFFGWLNENMPEAEGKKIQSFQALLTAITAITGSFVLLLLIQWGAITKIFFPPPHDNFYNKCIEWENKSIFLTLKNSKAYIGILWKFPENPKSRHESQTISIVPFKSGYRDEKTKKLYGAQIIQTIKTNLKLPIWR